MRKGKDCGMHFLLIGFKSRNREIDNTGEREIKEELQQAISFVHGDIKFSNHLATLATWYNHGVRLLLNQHLFLEK